MKRTNIPESIKAKIRRMAGNRCGYCLFRQRFLPSVLQIDHIIPISKGGSNTEENLWLLCENCNRSKSDKTEVFDKKTQKDAPIFNPRTQMWNEHFEWNSDQTKIIGKTPTGRGTVAELNLNNERIVAVRREWVLVGWHPPTD